MYAAWFVSRYRQANLLIPSILMLVFACVAVALMHYWKLGNFQWTDLFVGLTTCCALIVGALDEKGELARFFSHKFLLWVGAFSYSLYLIHKPVQLMVNWQIEQFAIGLKAAFLIRAIFGTALAVVVSYGFYQVFERPFLRRSPKGAITTSSAS